MDDFYREFGQRVREARRARGMSQAVLARRIGVGRTSVTNIEKGQQHIPLHLLVLLAQAVGTAPAALLPDEPPITNSAAPQPSPELLRGLGADEEAWVLNVVRSATSDTQEGPHEASRN